MLTAIIDLGTNTFHLLIADIKGKGGFEKIYRDRKVVKLLQGREVSNLIEEIPFQRGIQAGRIFSEKIKKYGVEKIVAYATSGIRTASNGEFFLSALKAETGIGATIISGDEEAEFIYFGVKQSINLGQENSLILDIGGGSNELIIANNERISWKNSFNLGAARMLSKFAPSDPILTAEISAIENFFEEELKLLFEALKLFPCSVLIGCSGSFDTFAEMTTHKFGNPEQLFGKKEFDFNLEHYFSIHQWLVNSTQTERMQMKGLVKMRVDMIVIASIFTRLIIEKVGIKKMRLSRGALKEGILWKISNFE